MGKVDPLHEVFRMWLRQHQSFLSLLKDFLKQQKISQHFVLHCLAIFAPTYLPTAILKLKDRIPENELKVTAGKMVSVYYIYIFALGLILDVVGETAPSIKTSYFFQLFFQVLGMSFALTLNCQIDKTSQALGLWPATVFAGKTCFKTTYNQKPYKITSQTEIFVQFPFSRFGPCLIQPKKRMLTRHFPSQETRQSFTYSWCQPCHSR